MTPADERPLGVIGVDGSSDSLTLVDFVRAAFHPSWSWLVVHVVDLTAPAHPDTAHHVEFDAAAVVEEAAQRLPGSTAIVEQSPDVADGLRSVASGHDASAVVVGAGESGLVASTLLGSVSSELLKHAPCPVLTFRTH